MPLHVSSTCVHHQEVKIALHSLWYHHTYRWPTGARDFDLLMMSTWCSKHVEAWNKLIVKQKFCASSWLITEINDNSVHLLILFTYPFLILSDPSQSQFTVCNHQPTDQCLRGLGGGKPVQITEARQCGRGAEDRLMFLSLSVVT